MKWTSEQRPLGDYKFSCSGERDRLDKQENAILSGRVMMDAQTDLYEYGIWYQIQITAA